MRAFKWLAALVSEANGKPSSMRVMTVLSGLGGIAFAFVHPDKPEMAVVLFAAAGLTSFARTKATGGDA